MHAFSFIWVYDFTLHPLDCLLHLCLYWCMYPNAKFKMNNLNKLDHMIKQLWERITLDQLHNLRQDDLSIREYIARFEDLTRRHDVRKHRSQTISRFVSGLRPNIWHAIITSSYGVDSIKDTFAFALKIDLTFKGIVSVKTWEQCHKCGGYGHYDYQCPS